MPEGFEENPAEEEGGEEKGRNELIYITGRLFRDKKLE